MIIIEYTQESSLHYLHSYQQYVRMYIEGEYILGGGGGGI